MLGDIESFFIKKVPSFLVLVSKLFFESSLDVTNDSFLFLSRLAR